MPSRRTIWLRRAALMAIVAIVVGIPATVLVRGSDDPEPDEGGGRATPALNPGVSDRGLRVGYQVPKGWRERKRDRTLRLESGDGSVLIAVAAPAPAGHSDRVRDDLLATIRSSYDDVEINRGRGRRIGGLNSKGAVVSAKQPEGGELRILVAVAEGEERTYVVEVFTAANAKANRIRQAQVALNSLELRG